MDRRSALSAQVWACCISSRDQRHYLCDDPLNVTKKLKLSILKERIIMRKHFVGPRILFFVIATACLLLGAQAKVLAQDKAARIDELMKVYHSYRLFNGAVLVAENGKVIFKKG